VQVLRATAAGGVRANRACPLPSHILVMGRGGPYKSKPCPPAAPASRRNTWEKFHPACLRGVFFQVGHAHGDQQCKRPRGRRGRDWFSPDCPLRFFCARRSGEKTPAPPAKVLGPARNTPDTSLANPRACRPSAQGFFLMGGNNSCGGDWFVTEAGFGFAAAAGQTGWTPAGPGPWRFTPTRFERGDNPAVIGELK